MGKNFFRFQTKVATQTIVMDSLWSLYTKHDIYVKSCTKDHRIYKQSSELDLRRQRWKTFRSRFDVPTMFFQLSYILSNVF